MNLVNKKIELAQKISQKQVSLRPILYKLVYTNKWRCDTMKKSRHKGVHTMSVTAKKWGNSIGVRIPFKLAQKYGVVNGTKLEIYDTQDGMMLKVSDRPTLDSLLSQCEGENPVEELFSDTVGKEEL